ncbi:MAG: hypothetical protein KIT79_06925 [Deltaproteobacteria bacterium]|nr:hypothetical protein [Deltaproteobacteria bacterium]
MSRKSVFIRKSSEKSKAPKKSHAKRAAATKLKTASKMNAHAVQKKATRRNPHGKSHRPGQGKK